MNMVVNGHEYGGYESGLWWLIIRVMIMVVKSHNYCPPGAAMFGVQRGEGADQFDRSGHELM